MKRLVGCCGSSAKKLISATKWCFSALLVALAFPLVGGDTPPRNWGQCPAVIAVDTTEVVYALGDTHGDYDRLVKLLVAGKLIAGVPVSPEDVTWSGGRSTLVITGDMIDNGIARWA